NQSKLPQYVLPLMPPFALAAARGLDAGIGVGRRTYATIAALLGLALVSLTIWLPVPISLTPGERAAIPQTALALGIALLVSAASGSPRDGQRARADEHLRARLPGTVPP